ncbi:MAG: SWIB/MDM2 domain-containing protein [Candidatus Aenigmatarchaeota archaeon]
MFGRRKVRRKTTRRRTTRRRIVKRKGKAFGGYHIVPDANLARVIGKGKVTPAQMTKKIWVYIKRKKLARK